MVHLLAVAAGCASPPDRLEVAELSPVPRTAAIAAASEHAGAAPGVLPDAESSALAKLEAEVRARGGTDLVDCFLLAEATHEALLSGDEDRLQAALRADLAIAGILPNVSLTAYALVQDRVPATSTRGGDFSGSGDREEWAITVRQPIFKGFAEFHAIRAAGLTEEARAASVEVIRAGLRRSVARAFFGVLVAESEVRTLEDAERLDRTRIAEMKARQENGLARRTEVLLLESQLQSTLAALQRAKTRSAVTRTTLHQLVGVEPPAPLVDRASTPGPVPTREAALAEAIAARPELTAAALGADAAEALIGVARAGRWPTVSFVGNWYLGRSGSSRFQEATDWDAQIALDVPLFEGGATRARERTAQSELRKARLAASAALRSVVQDVESALATVAADADLLATFERNAALAKENTGLLREEYAHGVATNLEVLTAQNVLREAQLEVERQRLVDRLDRIELSIALGRREIGR